MKKLFIVFIFAVFLLHIAVSCSNGDSAPSVSLNRTSATLVVGDTLHLSATVQNVIWSSTDSAVATVFCGMVIADSVGVARIVVTTEDGNSTAYSSIAVVASMQGCNTNTAGWGNSLGRVSFYTNREWTITENDITQIWSDVVTASNCQKTIFNSWNFVTSNTNADCRSNSGFPGDFFSWCAVVRFADQLCPYPWRVPTRQDFRDLDIALGGTGDTRNSGSSDLASPEFIAENYIIRWGGAFGGNEGSAPSQWQWGNYWSQSSGDVLLGHALRFSTGGDVQPQVWSSKTFGFTLRCVRDN